MRTNEFTSRLLTKLRLIFPPDLVIKEWNVSKNSRDDFDNREFYAPRVDIAIGPFNINRNLGRNNLTFNRLLQQHRFFLKKLYDASHLGENREYISFEDFLRTLNRNPRSFIAIEIENTKDAKQSLGDIINASVMGKVGIAVPIGQDKYNMFVKIKKYFHYLENVGKLKGNFRNVLIIEGNKLLQDI